MAAMTVEEIDALRQDILDRLSPGCRPNRLSARARRRYLHVEDPDDARDLAYEDTVDGI